MASAEKLAAEQTALKMLLMGYPTTGKTGALACLANAGFKLRVIDLDGNWQPLVQFTTPEARRNIDIVTLEDNIQPTAPDAAGVAAYKMLGATAAYTRVNRLLDEWKYKEPDGTEVTLGKPRDWGQDTILVIDSLSGLARVLNRWYLALNRKDMIGPKDWGALQHILETFIEGLTSGQFFKCHLIVTAHLRLTGPDTMDFSDTRKMERENPEFLEAKKEAAAAIPVRVFPVTIGRQLSTTVDQHFNVILMTDTVMAGGKVKRIIRTQAPGEYIDLRVPSTKLDAELPIDGGLLKVFAALGIVPPQKQA